MSATGGAGLRTLAIGLVVGLVLGGVGGYVALGPGSVTTSTSTQTMVSTASVTVTQSASASSASSASTPALPPPASVSVDPRTSAVLVLDYVFCYRMTGCNATLPAVQALLTNARSAGAPIIYTRTPI